MIYVRNNNINQHQLFNRRKQVLQLGKSQNSPKKSLEEFNPSFMFQVSSNLIGHW